jgi:hypothetical protein
MSSSTARKKHGSDPLALTALIDKRLIFAVRYAILTKTKIALANKEIKEGTYAALSAEEFKELLCEAKIPQQIINTVTEHIDVNDDGDIEFDEFINFVLAAESNLEFSQKAVNDKLVYVNGIGCGAAGSGGGINNSIVCGKNGHESLTATAVTYRPFPMLITGSSDGIITIFHPVKLSVVDRMLYVSKAAAINARLTENTKTEDRARLRARIKASGL